MQIDFCHQHQLIRFSRPPQTLTVKLLLSSCDMTNSAALAQKRSAILGRLHHILVLWHLTAFKIHPDMTSVPRPLAKGSVSMTSHSPLPCWFIRGQRDLPVWTRIVWGELKMKHFVEAAL